MKRLGLLMVMLALVILSLGYRMSNPDYANATKNNSGDEVQLAEIISLDDNSTTEGVLEYCESITSALGSEVFIPYSVMINAHSIPLFPEFTGIDEALSTLNNRTSDLQDELIAFESQTIMSQNDNLGDIGRITESNWQYVNNLLQSYISENISLEMDEDIQLMLSYFDIFENADQNQTILTMAASVQSKKDALGLFYQLPDNELTRSQLTELEILYGVYSSPKATIPNITNAVNYAIAYAINENSAGYGYFSKADCTNFASQILFKGGVAQNVYTSTSSGWWHKKVNSTHTHSVSWIQARTFARYMGIKYTTTNHKTFSQNIKKGDIIGYDRAADGDADHLGFITTRDEYLGTWSGKQYYDYKVAQHTPNYHAWASSSINGWDNLSAGTNYLRIRR